MIKNPDMNLLGLRGLMEQNLRAQDYHHAFVYGEKLFHLNPRIDKLYETLVNIIKERKIPIMVPMGIGDDGKFYNINADTAAGAVAKELNARRLLLMTDVEGVLDQNNNLLSEINSILANKMLEEGSISGGMIPKINTCLDSVNNGVTGVVIVDGRKPHSILFELFSDKGAGTLIRK